jgi:RNA polymerase sigma factor, sigma-70 family
MDSGTEAFRRYLQGEPAAFDEVMELYRENLIFFLCRFVPDLHTAEDLAEDAFVELLLHPHRFRFTVSLKTYLFAIGRNKALTWRKKARRCNEALPEDLACPEAEQPETLFLRGEQKQQISRALALMNGDYRTALHLLYFEQLSYAEIGRVMHRSSKQVENLVYRGRLALKKQLEKEGFQNESSGGI